MPDLPSDHPSVTSLAGEPAPLVVDVDGTLCCTDLLWEGLLDIAFRHPRALPAVLGAGLRGRAPLKAAVARYSTVDLATLPLRREVETLIETAVLAGQPVVLASGAHISYVEALAERVGAHAALGTSDTNLTGRAKRDALIARFGEFEYVGNDRKDLAIWERARRAYTVDASPALLRAVQRKHADVVPVTSRAPRARTILRALRPQQWFKNVLIFMPAFAAHRTDPALYARLLVAFLAFSFTASSVYLLNDLVDLPNDRMHRTKRHRPLATGALPIPVAVGLAPPLLGMALIAGSLLPRGFLIVLGGYFLTTAAYSLDLKRRMLLDVLCLALLYASRVVAGAAVTGVVLSDWFVAFFGFLFLSLALVKRVVELGRIAGALPGRGYHDADTPVLISLGVGASIASVLVMALYIANPESEPLYRHPQFLWLALPLVLYWQCRMWILAVRGQVDDDPIAFAGRDPVSYLAVLSAIALVIFAV